MIDLPTDGSLPDGALNDNHLGTLDAVRGAVHPISKMAIEFTSIVPILRIFDIAKADEFYQGYLGFKVDWDHRFDDNAPLYRQVSRGDLVLHLSEHHGDGSPGVRLRVMMRGVEEFHREISAKNYRYMRPGLEKTPWGTLETGAIDPFGNLIRFCERIDKP